MISAKQFRRLFHHLRNDIFKYGRAFGFPDPSPQQRSVLEEVQENLGNPTFLAVKSGQGVGKCKTGSTEIIAGGRRVTVRELAERGKPFLVNALHEDDLRAGVGEAIAFKSERKACVRLTTDAGPWTELSTDHPVLTPNGWVHAEKLSQGDLVALPRHLPATSEPLNISDAEVRYVALMLADGGCTAHPRFTQEDNATLAQFKADAEALGGRVRPLRRYEYSVTGMTDVARRWGFYGESAKTKRVPSEFFGLSDDQTALFLRWFWACDGYFSERGPGCTLANEALIRDLHILLLRLGIKSRWAYRVAKCGDKEFDAWRLTITGNADRRRFAALVGDTPAKRDTYDIPEMANTNTDIVLADSDVLWAKVASVEDIGWHDVYDVSVPEFGNFVAQGIHVHNTAMETWVGSFRAFRSFMAPTYVTAPTMRQVRDAYIKELSQHLEKADPVLKGVWDVQTTRATLFGFRDWGIIGLSAAKAENFAGLHHPHMSFIADEGSGLERDIVETIFGTLTNHDRLFLTCGNPTRRDCAFFDFFNSMSAYFTSLFTFNCEEAPDFIVDKSNLRRMEDIYGRDSDVYRVRVLGEFPTQDPNSVMSSDDLYECAKIDVVTALSNFAKYAPRNMQRRQFGIDFARFGSDRSVIYRRSGLALVEAATFAKTEPDVVVARAFEMQKRAGWGDSECVFVPDAGGMGQGVMHVFYRAGKKVNEFHNGGTAYDAKQYYDRITEAMFELGALAKHRAISIPNDPHLIRELSTRQYHIASGKTGAGRIKLESKEEYKRRGGGEESPDRADACALAFYPHVFTGARVATR